jgi:hypothetical protein
MNNCVCVCVCVRVCTCFLPRFSTPWIGSSALLLHIGQTKRADLQHLNVNDALQLLLWLQRRVLGQAVHDRLVHGHTVTVTGCSGSAGLELTMASATASRAYALDSISLGRSRSLSHGHGHGIFIIYKVILGWCPSSSPPAAAESTRPH